MSDTTPIRGYHIATGTDNVGIEAAVRPLAEGLDIVAHYDQGSTLPSDAAGTQGDIFKRITDETIWLHDGTEWQQQARSVDVQTFTANGTWTKPAGAKLVAFVVAAGGGGGQGCVGDNTVWVAGAKGADSSIGALVAAAGGYGAGTTPAFTNAASAGAAGGHYQKYEDAALNNFEISEPGAGGVMTIPGRASTVGGPGGAAGSYPAYPPSAGGGGGGGYGAGGAGGSGSNGVAAAANTGGGGGGCSGNNTSGMGGGGGGGGQVAVGSRPASDFGATEAITVGAGGAGGVSTKNGGAGGSGIVIVTTYF